MIVVPEDAAVNRGDVKLQNLANDSEPITVHDDPPPSYAPSSSPSDASSSAQTVSSATKPFPSPKATNYVIDCRQNHSIRDAYTIDPALSIPTSLLTPLDKDETESDRKNLRLESLNASVDVDISLVENASGLSPHQGRKRMLLSVKSQNGSVTARVHDLSASRLPVYMTAKSQNGSVNVKIPRSFKGLITVEACNGSVILSDELREQILSISTVNSLRRYFLGDLSLWSEGENGWEGDELIVETKNGRVTLGYDNEKKRDMIARKSFLGRIFGI